MRNDRTYDAALVCLNGHVINTSFKYDAHENLSYCDKCAAQTIHKCPSCSAQIRGDLYESDEWDGVKPVSIGLGIILPTFCGGCGEPYPWTKTKLDIAKQFATELDELSADDKQVLSSSLAEIVSATPKTELAIMRIKKVATKVGKESADLLKKIIAEIACEVAKKSMGM